MEPETPKAAGPLRARQRRAGLPEFAAGAALLGFVLIQQPFAVLPLALVISGLIGFGLLQLGESWPRLGAALAGLDAAI